MNWREKAEQLGATVAVVFRTAEVKREKVSCFVDLPFTRTPLKVSWEGVGGRKKEHRWWQNRGVQ